MNASRFVIAGASALIGLIPAAARANSCTQLWQERNQIYKDSGYCFTTPRAIRAFGNAGCRFDNADDVPFSANQRARLRAILDEERALDCR